ncbi:MAG: hypothetical protein ACO1OC_02475 [Tuberibacillus sp.]
MKKILHSKVKLLLSFTVALMCLGLFAPKSHAATIPNPIIAPGGGDGVVHGETISYQVTLTGETIVEMYMDVNTARQYANKVTQSDAEQIAWFASALLVSKTSPQGATYTSFIGLMSSLQRGHIASDVRSYTDQNKKVKVKCYISPTPLGKPAANYRVTSWNGTLVNMSGVSGIRNVHITYY